MTLSLSSGHWAIIPWVQSSSKKTGRIVAGLPELCCCVPHRAHMHQLKPNMTMGRGVACKGTSFGVPLRCMGPLPVWEPDALSFARVWLLCSWL